MNNLYKFTIKITQNDLFRSSLNYVRSAKTFLFDLIFTFTAIIITVYTIAIGSFFELSDIKKVLLLLCCFLFPVFQPILLYIKAGAHAKKIHGLEVTAVFDNDKITLYSSNEKSEVLYENVYNFIKYKDMIVVMYDSIHGQIIPNRYFDNNKDEFYDFVSQKIKDARKKQKEN